MAVLGITKLDAVNRMLRAVQTLPVAALSTGTMAIEGHAERVLDEVSTKYQISSPNDECTVVGKAYTPDGSGYVTVSSNVIAIQAAGSTRNKRVTLRGDKVWNLTDNTNVWSGTVTLDIVEEQSFEDLPPKIKEAIADLAVREFQQRYRGSQQQDVNIVNDAIRSDAVARQGYPGVGMHRPVPVQSFSQPSESSQ